MSQVMLAAYIACALWSTNDESNEQGGDPLDKNYSENDIHPSTRKRMQEDVETFMTAHREDIEGFGPGEEGAGYDLWLTRNEHGSGFWDGDWPEPAATRLTDAAHALGSFELYVGDDDVIYAVGCES